jgi:hypothetical protein
MRVPPLVRLLGEIVTLRKLLFNRFTLLVIVILLASTGVTGFVAANDDGVVEGRVVDHGGEPVEGARVVLRDIPLQGVVKTTSTTTGPDGRFEFANQSKLLEYQLVVELNGTEVLSEHNHLLFRGQHQSVELRLNESVEPAGSVAPVRPARPAAPA